MEGLTPEKRRQLFQNGWRPYSLCHVKDGKVVSRWTYKQLPFAAPFAVIGSMADQKRWRKEEWSKQSPQSQVIMSWLSGITFFKDISTLTSFTRAVGLSAYATSKPEAGMDWLNQKLAQTFGRTATGFIPSVVKEADQFVNSQSYRPTKDGDALGWWLQDVPVARKFAAEGPDINYIGEPTKNDPFPWRSWVGGNPNEERVWSTIGRFLSKNIWLPSFEGGTATVFDANGLPRDMTVREQYRYSKTAHTAMGQYLNEHTPEEIEGMDREEAVALITNYANSARKIAKALVQEEADTGKKQDISEWAK